MTSPLPSPDAKTVSKFHRNDDVDKTQGHHHTLGPGLYQSAGGRHNHQGGDSVLLFENVTITGSRSLNTADVINQILNALAAVGLVNNTGP